MNAVTRFLNHLTPLAAVAGLAASLCACVSLPTDETPQAQATRAFTPTNTTIDPNSAAAAEITRMEAEPAAWPTFKGVPPMPTDIRPSTAWRRSVLNLRAAGAQLVRDTAPGTFTLSGTDAFAANAHTQLDPRASAAPTAAELADSAAFVKAAHARATPPPRPH